MGSKEEGKLEGVMGLFYISILCVCKGELLVKTYICVDMHTMALSLPISLQEFKHPVFPLSNYLWES